MTITSNVKEVLFQENTTEKNLEELIWWLTLNFQLIVSCITSELYGENWNIEDISHWWEILSRIWENKISPYLFLKNLNPEEQIAFDILVLKETLKLYSEWRLNNYSYFHVNISPYSLSSKYFVSTIFKVFKEFNFKDFGKIWFGLTEDWEIYSFDNLLWNIESIRDIWISFWLDDYPEGNNNNELLSLIPNIDFIKIDKWFLLSIKDTSEDIQIENIKKLVQKIRQYHPGVSIIIEGVENLDIYQTVISEFSNIDAMQGFSISKPKEV